MSSPLGPGCPTGAPRPPRRDSQVVVDHPVALPAAETLLPLPWLPLPWLHLPRLLPRRLPSLPPPPALAAPLQLRGHQRLLLAAAASSGAGLVYGDAEHGQEQARGLPLQRLRPRHVTTIPTAAAAAAAPAASAASAASAAAAAASPLLLQVHHARDGRRLRRLGLLAALLELQRGGDVGPGRAQAVPPQVRVEVGASVGFRGRRVMGSSNTPVATKYSARSRPSKSVPSRPASPLLLLLLLLLLLHYDRDCHHYY